MSSALRLFGALEQHVLDEVGEMPLSAPRSTREPVPIQMPSETERTEGITSVTMRMPFARTVVD